MSEYEPEGRQVSMATALLMMAGGLAGGILLCLCGGVFALVITGSLRGASNPIGNVVRPTVENAGGTIEPGERQSSAIWDTFDQHEWTFDGQTGQQVTIEVRGDSGADPYVYLIGPDGSVIDENDDTFGLSSYLNLTLPDNGQYTIRIEMLSPGGYTLIFD